MSKRPGGDLNTRVLNAHHNEMVLKYLRFAMLYRKRQVKEMEGVFEEYKDTRLGNDESFTSDEVSSLLDNLCATLKADVYRNLQIMSNSNGILLKQLFAQAEDNVFNLSVDTSIMEDEFLLSMVQKLEETADSQTPKPSLLDTSSMASTSSLLPAKLPTLHDEKKAEELLVLNAMLKKQQLQLEEEVSSLKKELQKKEADHQRKIADITEKLNQQIEAEAVAAEVKKEDPSSEVSAEEVGFLHRRIRELDNRIRDLENEVEASRLEADSLSSQLASKLDQAPQFKKLKDFLKEKNTQVKAYRDKLVAMGWKPDDEEGDDADED